MADNKGFYRIAEIPYSEGFPDGGVLSIAVKKHLLEKYKEKLEF